MNLVLSRGGSGEMETERVPITPRPADLSEIIEEMG